MVWIISRCFLLGSGACAWPRSEILIAKHKHVTCQITTKTKMAEDWQKVEKGQGFFSAAVNPWDRVVSADQQLEVLGEDLLNCSICFERFKKPKILPCLHTFCQPCIQRHFEIYKLMHGGRLSCPTCRELITISGGVSNLRDDVSISNTKKLLDPINGLLQTTETEDAKMDFAGAAGPAGKEDEWLDKKEEIQSTYKAVHEVMQRLRQKMLKLHLVENAIVFTKQKECDDVNNERGRTKMNFLKSKKSGTEGKEPILKKIEEDHSGSLRQLAIEQDRLFSSFMELKGVHDVLEEALDRLRPAQLQIISSKLNRMTIDIAPLLNKSDSPTHVAANADVETLAAQWLRKNQKVKENPTEIMGSTGNLAIKKKRGNSKIGARLICKVGSRGSSEGTFNFPTHASFLPDGGFIVSDKNNYRVQVFDAKGNFKKVLFNNKVKPRRAKFNPRENAFYVVDEIMEAVKVYSPSGVLLRTLCEKFFSCPAGIDFDSNGNVVMTDADNCFISLHRPDGELVHKWYYRDGNDTLVPMPYYAIANEDDQIIVSDCRNNSVKMFNERGNTLFKILHLVCPRGICTDPYGNILIAEGDAHRISMYSPHGKFIQDVVTKEDGLEYPLSVDVNVEGQMIVTQCGYCSPHEVLMYQLI